MRVCPQEGGCQTPPPAQSSGCPSLAAVSSGLGMDMVDKLKLNLTFKFICSINSLAMSFIFKFFQLFHFEQLLLTSYFFINPLIDSIRFGQLGDRDGRLLEMTRWRGLGKCQEVMRSASKRRRARCCVTSPGVAGQLAKY